MKPYFPEEMEFTSADGKFKIVMIREDRTAFLERGGEKRDVEGEVRYPSQAVLSSRSNLVFLLGSHGDSGMGLGHIHIIDGEGRLVRSLELGKHLPELEALSREYSEHGNFEWITGTSLVKDDRAVAIEICGKKRAVVHAADIPPEISDLA